jgi:excisionase family DNA binding protein
MTEIFRSVAHSEMQRRALSVGQFCERYGVGRTLLYQQVQEGRLRLRKIGRRSLIAVEDAEIWFKNLRTVDPALPVIDLDLKI